MIKEVLSHFTLTYLPTIGFFIFLLCFVGVVFWTIRSENSGRYDKMSKLPLEDSYKES